MSEGEGREGEERALGAGGLVTLCEMATAR